MNMSNTKDKEAFFAAYWNQNVYYESYGEGDINGPLPINDERMPLWFTQSDIDECWLELTSLEYITDEDLKELAELHSITNSVITPFKYGANIEGNNGKHLRSFKLYTKAIFSDASLEEDGFSVVHANQRTLDFLRSKGYLVPFRQYSTDDLIQKKWVKVKSAGSTATEPLRN